MAIKEDFQVPMSAQELPLSSESNSNFFILYLSSIDPATNEPWCGDVKRILPTLNKTFSAESIPEVHYVYVGSRYEYKEIPGSRFRTDWNVNNVPTLVRYALLDNEVKEVDRLVEDELLDGPRLGKFISV